MKKLLILVLSISLLLCLCACQQNQTTTPTGDPSESTGTTEGTEATDGSETTEPGETTNNDGTVTYTVTVTDENGNGIAGAVVQLCKDTCVPTVADANGVATWTQKADSYKVSFLTLPAGYTYAGEETEFYFAEGETAMTIVLKAAE